MIGLFEQIIKISNICRSIKKVIIQVIIFQIQFLTIENIIFQTWRLHDRSFDLKFNLIKRFNYSQMCYTRSGL